MQMHDENEPLLSKIRKKSWRDNSKKLKKDIFETLPNEIITYIAFDLLLPNDMGRLMLTNKTLLALVRPLLLKKVALAAKQNSKNEKGEENPEVIFEDFIRFQTSCGQLKKLENNLLIQESKLCETLPKPVGIICGVASGIAVAGGVGAALASSGTIVAGVLAASLGTCAASTWIAGMSFWSNRVSKIIEEKKEDLISLKENKSRSPYNAMMK
jgi:hypothetical protein